MSTLLTGDSNQLLDLCRVVNCSQKIIEYIESHAEQHMTKTLRYISRSDCLYYGKIYRILFDKFGLVELDEPLYVKKLK